MDYKIKLGAVLKFDYQQEKDIINQIESLTSRHKLGEFISNLIRIAFDSPEIMEANGLRLEDFGISKERYEYFKEVESEMLKVRNRVDKIYDMALEMHTAAKFGRRIGLEDKSKNLIQSQFLLQRQIEELSNTFGVSNIGHTFESNKILDSENKSKEILEYILISYEDVISEIQSNMSYDNQRKYVDKHKDNGLGTLKECSEDLYDENKLEVKTESNILSDKSIVSKADVNSVKKNTNITKVKDEIDGGDEIIDFGQKADWDALSLFVGERV